MKLSSGNRRIGAAFDRTCAAPCRNGTFVGRAENGVTAFRGIPFALPPEVVLAQEIELTEQADIIDVQQRLSAVGQPVVDEAERLDCFSSRITYAFESLRVESLSFYFGAS